MDGEVAQHVKDVIESRITKLQTDWGYYTKPRRFSENFSPKAHAYYSSIQTRLDEIEVLLKELKL